MESFDINSAPLEIERKFLIKYPDIACLSAMPDYRVRHIEQTYLEPAENLLGGRIRRITEGDSVTFVYTYKQRLSDMTRLEFEREITEEEYNELMLSKRPNTDTISKDRHIFTFANLTYELDIYTFWTDKATLEAEVESETTPIPIPPCVELIAEVTADRRYNNSQLAVNHGVIE